MLYLQLYLKITSSGQNMVAFCSTVQNAVDFILLEVSNIDTVSKFSNTIYIASQENKKKIIYT